MINVDRLFGGLRKWAIGFTTGNPWKVLNRIDNIQVDKGNIYMISFYLK